MPQQLVESLPPARVTPARPFLNTGVDYAEPVQTVQCRLCRSIYSDCGTNFVGVDAQLRALFSACSQEGQQIAAHLAEERIEWHFNPPAAPNFGEIWEAAVKSTKHHLRRVIGNATLTYKEIATLLLQVEACLNSRPLQALTDDPENFAALTPGHFLGSALNAVPEPSLAEKPTSHLSRWQLLQRMRPFLERLV